MRLKATAGNIISSAADIKIDGETVVYRRWDKNPNGFVLERIRRPIPAGPRTVSPLLIFDPEQEIVLTTGQGWIKTIDGERHHLEVSKLAPLDVTTIRQVRGNANAAEEIPD